MKRFTFALMLIMAVHALWAQDGSGFSLSVEPSFLMPLPDSPSQERYLYGYGASLTADWIPPAAPFLILGGSVDFTSVPTPFDVSLNSFGAAALAGLRWSPLRFLSLGVSGSGGLALGLLDEANALTPYAKADAGATLYLSPSFRLDLGASYLHQFADSEALYQGLSISVGAGINFSQLDRRGRMDLRELQVQPIFPVFYKYYDDHSLGAITVRNGEGGQIRDVIVSIFIPQYMDAPRECARIPSMARGKEEKVELYALFTKEILGLLEPTKAQAQISVSYEYSGAIKTVSMSASVTINHRNASSWDDDRKAASFVTLNDPAVLRMAKSTAGTARASGYQSMDTNLRQAVGLLEQLRLYGLSYVPDPRVPYSRSSTRESEVDYLQFPAQTLDYRSGDCDDISILYASLLEASGVESAFITVPGHIFVAFALSMDASQARSFFTNYGDLIEQGGRVWMPVEVTLVSDGFVKAWTTGARQWREAKDQARLYPVHEAWELYEPVAMIGSEASVTLPKPEDLLARYKTSMDAIITREMDSALKAAQSAIQGSKDSLGYNKLGLVYARYGYLDLAEQQFRASLKIRESAAAYLNLGNVLLLKGEPKAALSSYQSANKLSPTSAGAVLGLVLASAEQGATANVEKYLAQLKALSPTLAERYASIYSGTSRASTLGAPAVEWEE